MNKKIFDYANKAKKISYGAIRSKSSIVGIVLHYTGNKGDTAKNNADYFANGNTRSAGAHIFIDRKGKSAYPIPIIRVAYSVGNPKGAYKRGAYFSTLNNANTVSIELCDIVNQPISDLQLQTLIKTVKWLKCQCKNIKYVARHYDVVQKDCPAYYVKNSKTWKKLQSLLSSYINDFE